MNYLSRSEYKQSILDVFEKQKKNKMIFLPFQSPLSKVSIIIFLNEKRVQ